MNRKNSYSFCKGYDNLRRCDQKRVKEEIMKFLQITTEMAWSRRIRGLIIPTVAEYNFITEIINKNGVPKKDIWEEIEL